MLKPETLLDALRHQLIKHKKEKEINDSNKERKFKQGYNEALNDVYEEIGMMVDQRRIELDLTLWYGND